MLGRIFQRRPILRSDNADGPWKCFHCWEVFHIRQDAAAHFGVTPHDEPLCQAEPVTRDVGRLHAEIQELLEARDRMEDKIESLEYLTAGHLTQLKAFKPGIRSLDELFIYFEEQMYRAKMWERFVDKVMKTHPDIFVEAFAEFAGEPQKIDFYKDRSSAA